MILTHKRAFLLGLVILLAVQCGACLGWKDDTPFTCIVQDLSSNTTLADADSSDSSPIISSTSPLVKSVLLERFSLDDFLKLLVNVSSPSLITMVEANDTETNEPFVQFRTTESNFQKLAAQLLMTLGNITTVMILVCLRIVFLIIDTTLIVLCVIYRNREPLRRKLPVSLTILILGLIHNSRAIVETLPVRKLIFLQYWNHYLSEKDKMDTFQFFTKYSVDNIPYWMYSITYFENIMCYLVSFGISSLYILMLILYFTPMTTFMLDRVISRKKDVLSGVLEKFKEETVKTINTVQVTPTVIATTFPTFDYPMKIGIELETLDKEDPALIVTEGTKSHKDTDHITQVEAPTILIESTTIQTTSLTVETTTIETSTLQTPQLITTVSEENTGDELTSSAITDIDEIFLTDFDTDNTEGEKVLASEGFENFTQSSKALKIVRFIEQKKIVPLLFTFIMFAALYIMNIFLIIFWAEPSPFVELFPVFENIESYCSSEKRTATGAFSFSFAILFPIVFLMVDSIDLVQSVAEYKEKREDIKRTNRKENLPNFFVYYFIDTDLFLCRLEHLLLLVFGTLFIGLFFLSWDASRKDLTRTLVSDIASVLIDIVVGIMVMPGISILVTVYRSWKERKILKMEENLEIMTVLNLNKFAPSPECIDFLIAHRHERQIFYSYLISEFSQENLLFLEDVLRFQSIPSEKIRYKIMKLREIVTLYLIENTSVFEVNISKKLIDGEVQPYFLVEHILHHHSIKMINLPKIVKDTPRIESFPEPLQNNNVDRELILNAFKEINSPSFMVGIITEAYSNLLDSYLRFINSRVWKEHVEKCKMA